MVEENTPRRTGFRPARVVQCLLLIAAGLASAGSLPFLPESVSNTPPESMVSLQLAPDVETAKSILDKWKARGHLENASRNLAQDSRFIPIFYGLTAFSVLILGVCCYWQTQLLRGLGLAFFGVIICGVAAIVDAKWENLHLKQMVLLAQQARSPNSLPEIANHVNQARSAAIIKFGLVIVAAGIWLSLFIAALRLFFQKPPTATHQPPTKPDFDTTIEDEYQLIGDVDGQSVTGNASLEPMVTMTPRELVGLALSGGGIRSATFALGVVSRLAQFGILQHVDYLSTVSGGGYLGGWLSAWRARTSPSRKDFPSVSKGERGEPKEVRHLREFSNFLVPRRGLFEPETWQGIIALVCGLIPALVIAIAVIAAAQFVWLTVVFFTAGPAVPPHCLKWAALLLTAFVVFTGKSGWFGAKFPSGPHRRLLLWVYVATALSATGLSAVLLARIPALSFSESPAGTHPVGRSAGGEWQTWCRMIGVQEKPSPQPPESDHWSVNMEKQGDRMSLKVDGPLQAVASPPQFRLAWPLFAMSIVWLAVGVCLCVARLALTSFDFPQCRTTIHAVDRVLRKLLIAGVLGMTAGGLWTLAILLNRWELGWSAPMTGAVGSASAFAWLRNSFSNLFRTERPSGVMQFLKPFLPILLANAAVLLLYVATASLLLRFLGPAIDRWLVAAFATTIVLALSLFLSPERFGLHEFYRARIARAFLGASNAKADDRNKTVENDDDDMLVANLPSGKPHHLICCAANDVAGDPLKNLNRGARSATVSRLGVIIGGQRTEMNELKLSAALTASAAAFNSQMGSISVGLGPAAAFLMCALNLRLGLWTPHPVGTRNPRVLFPGWRRYLEMFSGTRADESAAHVHLSDGGHFENLGLYELIRRRCRYIIVSDAGADPNVKLEDFGNAVRRVREDFDVDIEIDLDPLLPDARGESHQHVAVGTIRYDAAGADLDVGVLIFFKPTLTGDEPVDLLNYRALNPAFPHESTGDQFYDEAQWESYRSLGSHAAFVAFSFLDGHEFKAGENERKWIASAFTRARDKWYPTPPDFGTTLIDLNQRCLALEKRFSTEAPLELIREIYPELEKIEPPSVPAANESPQAAQVAQQHSRGVHLVIEIMQLIEDVWLTADFERNYNHPLMIGWINAFNRWTRTTMVRRWWTFLIPLFTPGMRKFAEAHFGVPRTFDGEPPLEVRFRRVDVQNDELFRCGLSRQQRTNTSSGVVKCFLLEIRIPDPQPPAAVANEKAAWAAVGAIRLKHDKETATAEWFDEDFQIRPGMWNTGLGSRFMQDLIKRRVPALHSLQKLFVTLDLKAGETHAGRGTGHRRERNDLIFFYKSLGFKQVSEPQPSQSIRLSLTIPQNPS